MANAYANFIPKFWSEKIQRELEKKMVYAEDCTREFNGKLENCGDTVHIETLGAVSIHRISSGTMNVEIEDPEEISSSDLELKVDQIAYFNIMVGDFEKAQSIDGVMEKISDEATYGLADEVDKYVAGLVLDSRVTKLNGDNPVAFTKDNAFDQIDDGLTTLYERNVPTTVPLVLKTNPKGWKVIKKALQINLTDNVKEIIHGKVYQYSNVTIKMTNNVARSQKTTKDDTANMMLSTKRACALVEQLHKLEPYRPEKRFADALKGYVLFGAKVVRPKEIININVLGI